ncbi:hypothetical protein RFI_21466 [Reticulomyxa filosa]|uniref:Uncharacterized protein n=1 Tax=Reticulomyxa filosa TaxID=46433 RepID=X6MR57_RETFI|nr:hypothetical protein RFI_21466 [Reticulomyxa filosa]|eukprot:ETO15897.1 hypothetical protein RFI_21466 [Reticulomyxa filosa]
MPIALHDEYDCTFLGCCQANHARKKKVRSKIGQSFDFFFFFFFFFIIFLKKKKKKKKETPLICQNSVTKYGFDKVLKSYLPQHTKVTDIAATLLSEEQEQKQLLRFQQQQQQQQQQQRQSYEYEHEQEHASVHVHEHEEEMEEDKEEEECKYHYNLVTQKSDFPIDSIPLRLPSKLTRNCNPTCLLLFKKHLQF